MSLTQRHLAMLAAFGLLLPLGLGTASPGAAATFEFWRLDEHSIGHPATDVSSLTLESGQLGIRRGYEDSYIVAEATLAGVPDAATDARLVFGLGQLVDDVCVPDWTVSTTTFSPSGAATREGRQIELRAPHAPEPQMRQWTCATVTLARLEAADVIIDRLEERTKGRMVADLIVRLKIHRFPKPEPVEPRRWTTVTLRVSNHAVTVDRIRVRG